MVLTNDADFTFVYDGESYKATPGTVLRFDGNIKHALVGNKKGRFAAIIWDIPIENSFIKEVAKLAERSIQLIFEFTKIKDRAL